MAVTVWLPPSCWLQQITALVSPDEALSFKILALDTEKAHNLEDRSLEVIRMQADLALVAAVAPSD
ncbi:MAG: hypothetical protein JRJ58_05945 [Deltaproteobacteria bacterium]|nr:hypothetical protein [Deltaproteobacteria bacterium]